MENQIDKKDLAQIQQNQEKRNKLLLNLGELELHKAQLLSALIPVDQEAKNIASLLQKKYGKVSIDLDTGEINPADNQ